MTLPNALYAQAGGVTAVINASAAGVIEACREQSHRIGTLFAAEGGLPGLLHEALLDTGAESAATVTALKHTPGGAFGSARFRLGEPAEDPATWARIAAVLREHHIGYLFYNGGNGSAATTLQLSTLGERTGVPLTCVHVPKTVDNDLLGTDCSPGFGSAAKYLATSLREAAADVASMASTSTRVFILEAMGRHAGWMVAAMGLAADRHGEAPHLLLFAEIPFVESDFLERVAAAVARHGHCVVGVSEGLRHADGRFVAQVAPGGGGHDPQLGGVAPRLAAAVSGRLGLKCHWANADYLQRSARHLASATDLAHAEAVGRKAVELALEGRNGVMATIERDSDEPYRWHTGAVALEAIAVRERRLPPEFITADGCHITDRCRTYLRPLIQGEAWPPFAEGLPVHARLRRVRVAAKLPPWQPAGSP